MVSFDEFAQGFNSLYVLARGGQKIVYAAQSDVFGSVVIKLFFKLEDPRSLREIEINELYDFKAVPKMFDNGLLIYEGEETLYVVEERIDGKELRDLINEGVRFSLEDAVDFLDQGLDFITQLEDKNIVHRDIKPENIMAASGGSYFFLDFGIARVLGMSSITKTEAFMGPHTPGYSAPEQFNNLKEQIDSRSDLFSIGVVTYECITGKNPFLQGAQSHLDVLQNTATITPVSLSIPGDPQKQFVALLGSLMGKYPSRRPRTANQALDWLNAVRPTLIF